MIAILTACHQRHQIFKLFLEHLPKDVQLICVGDDDENRAEATKREKTAYLIHENKPISNKWNAGLQLAKSFQFDYLIITGSDDFFSPDLWEWYSTLEVHYAGLLDFYFFDTLTNKLKYNNGFSFNRKGEPHGAGRALHRSVLEALSWELWDEGLNEGLDASMTERLRKLTMDYSLIMLKDKGFVAMDVKTTENIHQISEYQGRWVEGDERQAVLSKIGWTIA